jgi:ATP adenylyltransferase
MIDAVSSEIHAYGLDAGEVDEVALCLAAYTAVMDRLWTPWRYAYVTGNEAGDGRAGVPAELAAWPGDKHCVFCNMIAAVEYAVEHGMVVEAAEEATHILERGENCFLVLNAYPYNGGHLMVVPYLHEASLAGLPLEVAEEMMRLARRTERVLRAVYTPEGINFGFNLGRAAGAGVADHLHLHAVPRWGGDNNFMSVLAETRVLPEMLDESWRRIRAALAVDVLE